jgi:hypothetical protein
MSALDTARRAWGAAMPAWVAALAGACDRSSQRQAAADIGYSAAVVCLTLQRLYQGNLAAVERAVWRAYPLPGTGVACPALGSITIGQCKDIAARPFGAANHEAVRLYRACRACERGSL